MADRRFVATATPLAGLALVRRIRMEDDRGFLSRLYCSDEFSEFGFTEMIVQINQTVTHARGTVRGMHFQRPPHA
ncbi:MAG: dTDP-4-dehydrorhamnose 3,5-epimerase family protein, partial [Caulobacteraceae bacterium]|nr:dTDP-4-dehydrorhamnose 3,5-epimerase family protein [Caulobacteraceae bacterium]